MCHKNEGFSIDLRAVKKWNSRHAVMGSQSVLPGIFRLAMSGRSMSRIPTMGGLRPLAGGFLALHNWGCSWGLNPPVSRSARVM